MAPIIIPGAGDTEATEQTRPLFSGPAFSTVGRLTIKPVNNQKAIVSTGENEAV